MEKSLIHSVVPFPTGNQSSVIAEPGDGSLNLPSSFVTPERPSILPLFSFVLTGRNYKLNALHLKLVTELVRIICLITDQAFRLPITDLFQRLICKCYLMRAGRVNGHSQRNTLAVCQYHEFCALPPLGFTDFEAPFLAGTKLPSIKHSAQSICRFFSSTLIKTLHILSQVPSSSHCFKRLQQVLGCGYRSGRSFHLAPVLRIQRTPSKTSRFLFQGRPLLFNLGNRGSIFSHCFSVKYIARLIGIPPMNPLSANQL